MNKITALEKTKKLLLLELPSKYELEVIEGYIEGLFAYSKFKEGRIVKMAKTYPVNEKTSWGWMACKHLLTEGKQGVVKEVCWDKKRGFHYLIEFAEKTYFSSDGTIKDTDRSTSLYIKEEWLR